jgi:nitrite reductase/ring-hydroxylating ferredoxin subunit
MGDNDSEWVAVAPLARLEDPGTQGFAWDGWEHWGFVVRVGDEVAAFRNVCPHAGHPLHYAPDAFLTADGALLICASHGALFERLTGACIAGPCAGRALQRLAARVRAGMVEVAPERAY